MNRRNRKLLAGRLMLFSYNINSTMGQKMLYTLDVAASVDAGITAIICLQETKLSMITAPTGY